MHVWYESLTSLASGTNADAKRGGVVKRKTGVSNPYSGSVWLPRVVNEIDH